MKIVLTGTGCVLNTVNVRATRVDTSNFKALAPNKMYNSQLDADADVLLFDVDINDGSTLLVSGSGFIGYPLFKPQLTNPSVMINALHTSNPNTHDYQCEDVKLGALSGGAFVTVRSTKTVSSKETS